MYFFNINFLVEVAIGLRNPEEAMLGREDPFDLKLSNLVKHAKRDYEMIVKIIQICIINIDI